MKKTCKWLLRKSQYNTVRHVLASLMLMALLVIDAEAATFVTPTHSTTIALTTNNQLLVVVNRQKDSVSVIRVRDASGDTATRLKEIPVGNEPRFVALTPDNKEAYVTNAADGTVSVIRLAGANAFKVVKTIVVGTEPRGIAISPNGTYAFTANHTAGTVSIISTGTKEVIKTAQTGGNPQAIAITNDGDVEDDDETVFVTRFFSELIAPGTRPDGFDDSKQGVVNSFGVEDALSGGVTVARHFLKPRANSGFTADRRSFCLNTRRILQNQGKKFFNSGPDGTGDGASQLANEVFCPDPDSMDASEMGPIAKTPQGVYPNALHAALTRGNSLYVPNEGAAPEPVIAFDTNVQALIGVIDIRSGRETNRTVNLNAQIKNEDSPPSDTDPVLDRLFGNTLSAIDANQAGSLFLIVSRGGNYVIEAIPDGQGRLRIGAHNNVVRYRTGNMPTGVVISSDGRRAYTNNEVSTSVTAINLAEQKVLTRDINSSNPPAPGTKAHRAVLGKLAFFTALGTPDVFDRNGNGKFDIGIRQVVPLQFRGKASKSGWSSCASCHDDGRTDDVAWSFETGPRKSIDLSGTFGRGRLGDQRIMNWSAVRGSPATDFDQNARAIQGGIGFATDVNGEDRKGRIFNHGPVTGVSDSLDAMHEWIATVRPLHMPKRNPVAIARGSALFKGNCASCHGGVKWTKSRTSPVYDNDPTYPVNPIGVDFFVPVEPFDGRIIQQIAGKNTVPQIPGVVDQVAGTLILMDDVGTFNLTNPIELRGGAAIALQDTSGFRALPVDPKVGFNAPSLLNAGYHAPFLHNGSAPNLDSAFNTHRLPQFTGAPTIRARLNAQQRADLRAFLNSIDGDTDTFKSDTDEFLERLGL